MCRLPAPCHPHPVSPYPCATRHEDPVKIACPEMPARCPAGPAVRVHSGAGAGPDRAAEHLLRGCGIAARKLGRRRRPAVPQPPAAAPPPPPGASSWFVRLNFQAPSSPPPPGCRPLRQLCAPGAAFSNLGFQSPRGWESGSGTRTWPGWRSGCGSWTSLRHWRNGCGCGSCRRASGCASGWRGCGCGSPGCGTCARAETDVNL